MVSSVRTEHVLKLPIDNREELDAFTVLRARARLQPPAWLLGLPEWRLALKLGETTQSDLWESLKRAPSFVLSARSGPVRAILDVLGNEGTTTGSIQDKRAEDKRWAKRI